MRALLENVIAHFPKDCYITTVPVWFLYPRELQVRSPQEPGASGMKVEPFHNSATSLLRQVLIKGVSASAADRKSLFPFEKDGIRLGCSSMTEVCMFPQISKCVFVMTPILPTPQWDQKIKKRAALSMGSV